jgi:hypothetical protein
MDFLTYCAARSRRTPGQVAAQFSNRRKKKRLLGKVEAYGSHHVYRVKTCSKVTFVTDSYVSCG